MAVDIGYDAIDRLGNWSNGWTIIAKGATASKDGTIVTLEIWAYGDITGLRVGSFYTTNGNTLKCRDSVAIAGTITAGSKVEKVISLTVVTGDYIGCYFTGGSICRSMSGATGIWQFDGEAIDPNDEETYNLYAADDAFSLGGYFEVAAAGRSFGFIIG